LRALTLTFGLVLRGELAQACEVLVISHVGHGQEKPLEVWKVFLGIGQGTAQDAAMFFFRRDPMLRSTLLQAQDQLGFEIADDELSHAIIASIRGWKLSSGCGVPSCRSGTGQKVAVILSGGNVDREVFAQVLAP
jgi:hypothetical protein